MFFTKIPRIRGTDTIKKISLGRAVIKLYRMTKVKRYFRFKCPIKITPCQLDILENSTLNLRTNAKMYNMKIEEEEIKVNQSGE